MSIYPVPPWPMPAVVVSQDPDNYAVYVSVVGFMGGQGTTLPVKVLTAGPRDAVRGHYPELPTPGTHGLVVFARGDLRSGHWMGATDPALVDASTLSPGSGNVSYAARWSGAWDWHGQDGTTAMALPDGSTFLLAPSGGAMPVPTRHVVGADQARSRAPFGQAQRVAMTLQPFLWFMSHPSGASLGLSPDGTWTIASASGNATLTLLPDGSASVRLQSGKAMTVSAGGTAQAVRLADGSASTTLRAE